MLVDSLSEPVHPDCLVAVGHSLWRMECRISRLQECSLLCAVESALYHMDECL